MATQRVEPTPAAHALQTFYLPGLAIFSQFHFNLLHIQDYLIVNGKFKREERFFFEFGPKGKSCNYIN